MLKVLRRSAYVRFLTTDTQRPASLVPQNRVHHRMEEPASARRSAPNLATAGGFARRCRVPRQGGDAEGGRANSIAGKGAGNWVCSLPPFCRVVPVLLSGARWWRGLRIACHLRESCAG